MPASPASGAWTGRLLDWARTLTASDPARLGSSIVVGARDWWPLLAGALLLLGSGLLAARVAVLQRMQNERVSHTLEVINTVEGLTLALTEATAAQRGRVLTGDETYAMARNEAMARVAPTLNRLEFLTADNIDQRPRVARLRQTTQARRAEITFVTHLLDTGRIEAARRRTSAGREQMIAFRQTADAILAHERVLLERRRARAEATGRNAVRLIALSLVVAALLAWLTIDRVRTQARQIARANEDILSLNRDLEARVADRTASLAEANAEIQRFVYIASHDLRSPLVNVMGFTAELEVAHQEASDLLADVERHRPELATAQRQAAIRADMPEAIGFIRSSTQRMDGLIRAILDMSRVGRRELRPEQIDLNALVGTVVDGFQTQAASAGADISIAALGTVESDRMSLEQVFANLIENALKYARPGVPPEIRIWAEVEGLWTRIHVADNGRGIKREDHERVFELFRRAGTQDLPGEGIGLANVRAIVRRLGGSIALNSELGAGSRFTVTLRTHMPPSVATGTSHGTD